jgi:hypothetical protein
MLSTLTARMRVGKQSKKIERNTLKEEFPEILLLKSVLIVPMIAGGFSVAQLEVAATRLVQTDFTLHESRRRLRNTNANS